MTTKSLKTLTLAVVGCIASFGAAFADDATTEVVTPTPEQVAANWRWLGHIGPAWNDYVITNEVTGWAFRTDSNGKKTMIGIRKSALFEHLDLSALDGEHELLSGGTYEVKTIDTITGATSSLVGLKTIKFPTSLTTINSYAFANCADLVFDFNGADLSSIGDRAFSGCASLGGSLVFSNLLSIGGGAFNGASSLISIEMPQLTQFGQYTFSGCSSLIRIEIPNVTNLVKIQQVQGCNRLKALKFSHRMFPWESSYVFMNCNSLKNIFIHRESPVAKGYLDGSLTLAAIRSNSSADVVVYGGAVEKDGIAWVYDDRAWDDETTNYLATTEISIVAATNAVNAAVVASLEIPKTLSIEVEDEDENGESVTTIAKATVTAIEACAFKSNTGLTLVKVPETVTRIGVAAFPEGCFIKVKLDANDPDRTQALVDQLNVEYGTDEATGKPYASIDQGDGLRVIVR